MSERWRYQLKKGLLWGILMTVGLTVFESWSSDNWDSALSWKTVVRAVIFLSLGVFVVGYFSWRDFSKSKRI